MRDSRDGDYRILQAVTEDPRHRAELGQMMVHPLAMQADPRVDVRDQAVNHLSIGSHIDGHAL